MRRHLMKSEIHRATITSANLHDDGSLTLDRTLMAATRRAAVVFVDGSNRIARPPLSMET